MRVIELIKEMQKTAENYRLQGKKIAFVPTMGYLHGGHLSLIRLARSLGDIVIVSVFVNPKQFGPNEDYDRYPRDFERDKKLAYESGADIIFYPDAKEMYSPDFLCYVEVEHISCILEGAFRPMHFRGVCTVVAKLFNIVKPHIAIFGQKDAQQAFIIKKMVKDLNFDIEIVTAPIVRENDGLAMSSRNVYLSESERKNATALYKALQHAEKRIVEGERSVEKIRQEMLKILESSSPSQIDYVAFVDSSTFQEIDYVNSPEVLVALAVRYGSTRLIDNIIVKIS